MSDKQSYIENEYVEFWIEDGIVYEIFKPHVTEVNLDMAKTIVELRLKISAGHTRPLFIDSVNVKDIHKEARKYFYKDDSLRYISASAFLVHSYVPWLVGKIFTALIPSKVKTDLFRTKTAALNWLSHYKELN